MQDTKIIAIMYWVNLAKIPMEKMRSVILTATGGKSSSRKGLSDNDYAKVIIHLKRLWRESETYKKGRNMRAKIIAVMCELGYKTNCNLPDYERINVFFEKHGAVKKPFTEMNYSQLQRTVTQVTAMLEKRKAELLNTPKKEYDLDNNPYK